MTSRIGVNLLWLVPGDVGGSEESTVASLRALAAQRHDDLGLRLFALDAFARAHPEVTDAIATELLASPGSSRARRIIAEATWLARRTAGLDLVHHAGGTAPLRPGPPYVLTVHDLQPLELPGTHSRLKRTYLRAVLPRSIARAAVIVVPSEFVKLSVTGRFGVSAEVVRVVPHGVEVHPAPTPEDALRSRWGLGGPVVLYPAITYPHKNHRVLVEAFGELRREHPDAVLVLTGRDDSAGPAVTASVERLGLTSHVRRLGRIPAADLAGLYRLASVVAVPSRYEGFGLPAVEALAHGAPLVAAATTSLPEVVGDAGVLVDPDDVGEWTAALDSRLRLTPPEREAVALASRARAAKFSWSNNAEALLAAYRAAL